MVQITAADLRKYSPASSIAFLGPTFDDPDAASELLELHRRCEADASSLERQSWLVTLIARLLLRHSEAAVTLPAREREPRAVGLARDYLVENLGDKVTRAWLERWIKHPDAYRPDTRMPSFFWFQPKGADWKPIGADGQPLPDGRLGLLPVMDSHLFDEDLTGANRLVAGEGSFVAIVAADWPELPVPGGQPGELARRVGRIRAMRMALLAERIPAAEAHAW